jgi:hypothetical protein
MTGRRSPRRATEGDGARSRLSTPSIARRPPTINPVVVDDFALNPDIDFPIACFERWQPESCDDDGLHERIQALEGEVDRLRKQARGPSPPVPHPSPANRPTSTMPASEWTRLPEGVRGAF